ncbi:bifunctional DNA primase/polymerase [Leuconostoc lactis]|uniref:bifunctional DNA primase/polymerase n=1 Tax=Leuconostoc lactis TaxID=1246 RepID=UPI0025B1E5EF|nr:bifunctional DNA primase/polymerase [Leuconostoc lactis]MDN2650380.1 bifunctional DNA primase/polymerase [Leuconostoc lactis]
MNEDRKKALEQKFGDRVQEIQNNIINSNYTTKGQELIEQGFAVYLLSQGTNTPHKGSNGHLDATRDVNVLANMFDKYGVDSNIGIVLQGTNLVCLDIDRHTPSKNGLRSLLRAGIKANFDNETVEKTPRNGLHIFFRVPDSVDVTNLKRNLLDGVELITDRVTVAPSVKQLDGGFISYQHIGKPFSEANMMPQWLIDLAYSVPTSGHTASERVPKYSIDQRLEMILNGFQQGQRNSQVMSFSGWLLSIRNIDPNLVYELVQKINSYSAVPLPEKEVKTIFRSAYNRQVKHASMGGVNVGKI